MGKLRRGSSGPLFPREDSKSSSAARAENGRERREVSLNASQRWIATLLDGLDAEVDEEKGARVLEACGRNCLPKGLKEKARKLYENAGGTDDFVQVLAASWPAVKREEGGVFVVYPQCHGHFLKGFSGELSPSWCRRSVGYVKELFERATGRPVEVKLQSSIVGGGSECRFAVLLER